MNKIAVYPGSFDPPHYGHIAVLREACKIFDKVIVLISVNPAKKGLLTLDDKYLFWKDTQRRERHSFSFVCSSNTAKIFRNSAYPNSTFKTG